MTEAQAMLRELAEPWPPGDKVKAAIARAAKHAGLSYWRAFDIWYGKARRVESAEKTQIAAALNRRRLEASRHELHEIRLRVERLEALLAMADPDFRRPDNP